MTAGRLDFPAFAHSTGHVRVQASAGGPCLWGELRRALLPGAIALWVCGAPPCWAQSSPSASGAESSQPLSPAGPTNQVLPAPASSELAIPTRFRLRPAFVNRSAVSELTWVVAPGVLLFLGSRILPQNTDGRSTSSRSYDATASRISDWTGFVRGSAISLGAGVALEALHLEGAGWDWLYTPSIAAESAVYAAALSGVLKSAVGRCRPVAWNSMTSECEPGAPSEASGLGGDEVYRAFPSNHVAPIAAIGATYLNVAFRTAADGDFGPWRFVAAGLAGSLTGLTMHYRIASGAHSRTDVWGGLAVGAGVGTLLSWIHPVQPVTVGKRQEPSPISRIQVVPHPGGLAIVGEL